MEDRIMYPASCTIEATLTPLILLAIQCFKLVMAATQNA